MACADFRRDLKVYGLLKAFWLAITKDDNENQSYEIAFLQNIAEPLKNLWLSSDGNKRGCAMFCRKPSDPRS